MIGDLSFKKPRLTVRDALTDTEHTLPLIIKLSDFGIAHPLDLDASHFSVKGHAGTIKYMAPETFRPTTDGLQRLGKAVDVWGLGVMLFQMLHAGNTPFDRYCGNNNIRAAVAIASEHIHHEVMEFDRSAVWAAECQRLQAESSQQHITEGSSSSSSLASPMTTPFYISVLATEFLFRMCERCLAFDHSDRVVVEDLVYWVECLLDKNWWAQTLESLGPAEREAMVSDSAFGKIFGETHCVSGSDHSEGDAPDISVCDTPEGRQPRNRGIGGGVDRGHDDVPADNHDTPEGTSRATDARKLGEGNLLGKAGSSIERVFFPGLRRESFPPARGSETGSFSLEQHRENSFQLEVAKGRFNISGLLRTGIFVVLFSSGLLIAATLAAVRFSEQS